MKANEAPEKIYLTSDEKNSYVFTQKRSDGKGIEYTRTDVIAKKIEVKDVDLIINTIIAECCDWLAMNTNLSNDKIEDCHNLMLTVKRTM